MLHIFTNNDMVKNLNINFYIFRKYLKIYQFVCLTCPWDFLEGVNLYNIGKPWQLGEYPKPLGSQERGGRGGLPQINQQIPLINSIELMMFTMNPPNVSILERVYFTKSYAFSNIILMVSLGVSFFIIFQKVRQKTLEN